MYCLLEGRSEEVVRTEAHATWVLPNHRGGGYFILRLLDWEAALGNAWEVTDEGLPKYQISLTTISPTLARTGEPVNTLGEATPASQARRLADDGLGQLVWVKEGNSRARLLRRARLWLEALDADSQPALPAA